MERRIRLDVPAFGPAFAEAYTRHWPWHSISLSERFPDIVRKYALRGTNLVDIACGEGTFAREVARRGWTVTGVDQSPDMLALAAREDHAERVTWLRQDIRELSLPAPADVVTCWYNSLNYLPGDDDLAATFRAVRQSLVPGGAFLFDVYTIRGLATEWVEQTYIAVDSPDCYVTSETRFNSRERVADVRFVGFIRVRSRFVRFEERHKNRGWSWATIKRLLHEAGFTIVGKFAMPDLTPPPKDAHRIYVVARVHA